MKRNLSMTRTVEVALSGWLVVTLFSQHPNRLFDRLRSLDAVGLLIPNWRFFAPFPARHDFHVLYRTLSTSGDQSEWKQASSITPRKWSHVAWFPERREEKAIFDLSASLDTSGNTGDPTKSPAYLLLRNFVARSIRENDPVWPQVTGFQFLLAQYGGYDDSEPPEYVFVSPFVPIPESKSDQW